MTSTDDDCEPRPHPTRLRWNRTQREGRHANSVAWKMPRSLRTVPSLADRLFSESGSRLNGIAGRFPAEFSGVRHVRGVADRVTLTGSLLTIRRSFHRPHHSIEASTGGNCLWNRAWAARSRFWLDSLGRITENPFVERLDLPSRNRPWARTAPQRLEFRPPVQWCEPARDWQPA